MALNQFHPAVKSWFKTNFHTPTQCQQDAWPKISSGRHTLVAAPTGSGKTLAAFLAVIDQLVKDGTKQGELSKQTQILYLSPLKALSNDIQKNLEQPLTGIRTHLLEMGYPDVYIQSMVRTGDTPAATRTAMIRKPPHILVTTPESLYILLTSESGRHMLKSVHSVIVDEIHAVAASKRGSHLALSLQRLEHLSEHNLTRIGLSATQQPIEAIAHFLLGSHRPISDCEIIDSGHKRALDLAIELPDSPLEALLSGQAAGEIYDKLQQLINQHKTTLVFVNTRRMAERVARHLSERLDADQITSHHGSLAREQRLDAETRLKAGKLRALVATASLELGIDIGDVDLVCQMGTTGSIATFLQRVGRSGHTTKGLPKGRLFPTSRDELVECIALIDSVHRGELDKLVVPPGPLDVLAQQIVAMLACEEWQEQELYDCIRQAAPYENLGESDFQKIITMLAQGFNTQRGRRSAYIYHDTVNKKLRGRANARLTAITCGGAIPDNADYRVILQPRGQFIGTVDEDFAMETLSGDIFQLGNSSWRVLRLDAGDLQVEDAQNQPPSIPFWFGEAPGRSIELSFSVSRLRQEIARRCEPDAENLDTVTAWLQKSTQISTSAARQSVNYIAAAQTTLTAIPSFTTLILERFFDESGGLHLILHAPFGSRINRAWGLALRKRFCRTFNFELQAAATENAIILSMGSSQSFELEAVAHYLNSASVKDLLIQALLDAPMFNIRWRWNCTCSLAVRRFQAGKKTPPYLVRMQSEDLVTSVFPEQLACQENLVGDREIPSHPLIQQTINDCLTDVMDIDGLIEVLRKIETRQIKIIARDIVEPSPFAAEILTARNYAFLDGAPAEERRTRAVMSRRWLDPETATDLGKLDVDAIRRVYDESWPQAKNADELHDALLVTGFIDEQIEANEQWFELFKSLTINHRAARIVLPTNQRPLWAATENLQWFATLFSIKNILPANTPLSTLSKPIDADTALTNILRARLNCTGPSTLETYIQLLGLEHTVIERSLLVLESEGTILRGQFTPETIENEWCDRRLLARIHRYTIGILRKQIEPANIPIFMRFLFAWQHISSDTRMQGSDALFAIIQQFEGFEASAVSWESEILPTRMHNYNPDWLDALCTSGKIRWSRLSITGQARSTIKSSPITLMPRRNLDHWLQTRLPPERDQMSGIATRVMDSLTERGALFFEELAEHSNLLPSHLESALAELVARGFVSCDSFSGLRALLVPERKRRGRLQAIFDLQQGGRWSLIQEAVRSHTQPRAPTNQSSSSAKIPLESIEHCIAVLLKRYGILFRALLTRESLSPGWSDLLPALRRMEARGNLRGGRFVAGQYGEQFALPEAVESLRKFRNQSPCQEMVTINASDPLNLIGIIAPGNKFCAKPYNRILFRDGIPVAVQSGKDTHFLEFVEETQKWDIKQRLVRSPSIPQLRRYLDTKSVL